MTPNYQGLVWIKTWCTKFSTEYLADNWGLLHGTNFRYDGRDSGRTLHLITQSRKTAHWCSAGKNIMVCCLYFSVKFSLLLWTLCHLVTKHNKGPNNYKKVNDINFPKVYHIKSFPRKIKARKKKKVLKTSKNHIFSPVPCSGGLSMNCLAFCEVIL